MKILSITAQKPHSTGSGIYLTELVKSFDKAGHRQAVVAGIYASDEVNFPASVKFYPVFFNQDISYPIVGMSDVMPYPSTKYSELDDKMLTEFENAFIPQIKKAIDELEPDLIICHHLFLLTALVQKHFPSKKIYGICHGSDLRQFINCKNLQSLVQPEIRKLNHIFSLHEEQATQISKLFGIAPSKISVIGSGYNQSLFNTDNRIERKAGDPVRICFAGKLSLAKGVNELLDAVEMLNENMSPKFTLTLAGGCQEETIKSRLDKLPSNVKYLGQISQTELAKVYKSNDIFILPSYYEGLGLVLIEAMASGLVPISTDLPGVKNWIDSNVTNPNVVYIPMPEMAGVDTPTDSGRIDFISNIEKVLTTEIEKLLSANSSAPAPNCQNISWDKVSEKILNL